MIEEALWSVDLKNMLSHPSNPVLMRLAETAHASHPDWVIDIAERMAGGIMEAGRSGLYELAGQWLEKSALAYDAAGRFEDWITRIDVLFYRHRRKQAPADARSAAAGRRDDLTTITVATLFLSHHRARISMAGRRVYRRPGNAGERAVAGRN